MSEPRLISSAIGDLLPMTGRSPGRHISAIIRSLCVSLGHYASADFRDAPKSKMALGHALEHALAHQKMLDSPGRYYRWWDSERQYWRNDLELRRRHNGIYYYGILDLLDLQDWAVEEIKLTWMSSRHAVDSAKLIRFWWQLKAYLYMLGARIGRLTVVYPRADYSRDNNDVEAPTWENEFTEEELERNWMMLMQHAENEMDWTKDEEA